MKAQQIVDGILRELKDLNPYIYHKALTGSIYVKFKDKRLRSVRIADHNGRAKYRYKWNIFKGYKEDSVKYDKGVRRYFFSFGQFDKFLIRIRQYWNTIQIIKPL